MKKIGFIILLLIVALMECKKVEKLEANLVVIDDENITVGFDDVTIITSYTYKYEIKATTIIYSKENTMASGQIKELEAQNGRIVVYLDELEMNTTYYYQYEFQSGYNSMKSEIKSFTTLRYTLPDVETVDVHDVTETTALCGGKVLNDGGYEVIARGVCWSEEDDPTIDDPHTVDGAGLGEFESLIEELVENQRYYVKAYATNSTGTAYGEVKTFVAGQNFFVPIVHTSSQVINMTSNSAECGGEIESDGNMPILAKGLCWSVLHEPTIITVDNHKTDEGPGAEDFQSAMTGLDGYTTYYVRAYATNAIGTGYGEERQFTTPHGPQLPDVVTSAPLGIGPNSAICGGRVISIGYAELTSKGICWSENNSNPTLSDNVVNMGSGYGLGNFSQIIEGLEPDTRYYVRAFATNIAGTAYGETFSFVTMP